MPQHASSPEPDIVTTLRRCCVSCTGLQFGAEWSSNSPVWCVRSGIVWSNSYLYLADDIRLVSEGNRRSLRLCVRFHVRTTASETEALELPVREFGNLQRGLRTLIISYKHFKTILKTYVWLGHGALWHLYMGALEIFLLTYTYLLTNYN